MSICLLLSEGGYFGFEIDFLLTDKDVANLRKVDIYEGLFVNRKLRISARHKDQSQE